jgi:DNA polymerase V
MHVIHQVVTLPVPTAITSELVRHMLLAFRRQWRAFPYKKAGVVLMNLSPAANQQQVLFDERPRKRDERLQNAIDHINRQYGKSAVKIGTQILASDAQPFTKKDKLSPCYTTNIREIIKVKC